MSEEFRTGCARFGVGEDLLRWSVERSGLNPVELLTIDTTTSARNFRISYTNQDGARKWAHLFLAPGSDVPS